MYFDNIYNQVFDLVKSGLTTEEACKSIGFSFSRFHQKMTTEQKDKLKSFLTYQL